MSRDIQPIFIMPEDTKRTTGRNAQRTNILAAQMVAETVRTTLGPKGMDKMIVDSLGDVTVTNDGVTILEEMQIEHPAAKMIVEVAKTQESEVGDGTTTAVVLAGELLKNAEILLDKNVHPTIIVKGYRLAANKSQEILNEIAEDVSVKNNDVLLKIAMTAMTGKGAEGNKELLSELTVNAVKSVIEEDNSISLSNIKVEKKVGSGVNDSELIEGIVIDKERAHPGMPKAVANAKIALIDREIEIKKTEMDGANVLFCQKGIDDLAQHFLAKEGIFAVRRAKKSDMEGLARATGGNIVSNLDDLDNTDLGFAGIVEEVKVGDEEMIYVRKCKNPKSVTLLIRGGTEHVVDEVKRAVDDALGDVVSSLKSGKVVGGAGAPEIELSRGLRKFAHSLKGREQLAVEAFADAVEVIPRTLAENAGLDPIDILTELKQAHDKKQKWAGINVFTGKIVDSWRSGVIEPLKIKTQAIKSASEVANLILRIDDIIAGGDTAPSGAPPGAMPPGMGGMPPM